MQSVKKMSFDLTKYTPDMWPMVKVRDGKKALIVDIVLRDNRPIKVKYEDYNGKWHDGEVRADGSMKKPGDPWIIPIDHPNLPKSVPVKVEKVTKINEVSKSGKYKLGYFTPHKTSGKAIFEYCDTTYNSLESAQAQAKRWHFIREV